MTAITGNTIAGVGGIVEDSSTNLRVEVTFDDASGPLVIGELFRVESGDEVIVTELRAYRLDERGACLLLSALHRASVRDMEQLAKSYFVDLRLDEPVADRTPQTVTFRSATLLRRKPVLGAEIEGVISRLRLSFTTEPGKRSRRPRLVPSEASQAFLFMREMVAPAPSS